MEIDHARCPICDWPLGNRMGRQMGSCSYRPNARGDGDPMEIERIHRRHEALDARLSPTEESVEADRRAAGIVTHDEAREILDRYNASHWRGRAGASGERARYSIPADPRRDDDIRLDAYIARAERIERGAKALLEEMLVPGSALLDPACVAACAEVDNAIAGLPPLPVEESLLRDTIDADSTKPEAS